MEPGKDLAITTPPTVEEVMHLAARIETMAKAFKSYGSACQSFNTAVYSLRSAVGHIMAEMPNGNDD